MTEYEALDARVEVSKEILGHPHYMCPQLADELPVQEGIHYRVVACTEWCDYSMPITIRWHTGDTLDNQTDTFASLERSAELRNKAVEENGIGEEYSNE